MYAPRSSGILLHPTSLPGPNGVGELGPAAFKFADWLHAAGQNVWQVLPLGPTGYGESPYQLFSAFAGNPLLISLETAERPNFPEGPVDFERAIPWKQQLLRQAFDRFSPDAEFDTFTNANQEWLEPYAKFMALKDANGGVAWTEWSAGALPDSQAVEYHKFTQFEFFRQWDALRSYCAGLGIRLMGDVPIYVAHDSVDVWANPELFQLDETGRPLAVAGVPPDYFSSTGQLWGNPVYRWDRMAETGYIWWIARMRAAFRMFDLVRMDHFRGFEAYWEVPASEPTAVNGRWVKGPGSELFSALEAALGPLPIVAENLGVITPEVEAIRDEFHFPGMAVLQFAFGTDPQASSFQPHNYTQHLVAYSGTHDNDTVMGWWNSEGGDSTRSTGEVRREKARARAYLNTRGAEMNWTIIRTAMASVANTVIFPAQDVLGLGSEARMNTPSVPSGNWRWRLREGELTPALARRLQILALLYERST
jgi:4-alpha-glucanotransferase